jgi:hypothetical protein
MCLGSALRVARFTYVSSSDRLAMSKRWLAEVVSSSDGYLQAVNGMAAGWQWIWHGAKCLATAIGKNLRMAC